MIHETETPQEAKSVYPGSLRGMLLTDPGRYFTQRPQRWFSRETAQIIIK